METSLSDMKKKTLTEHLYAVSININIYINMCMYIYVSINIRRVLSLPISRRPVRRFMMSVFNGQM